MEEQDEQDEKGTGRRVEKGQSDQAVPETVRSSNQYLRWTQVSYTKLLYPLLHPIMCSHFLLHATGSQVDTDACETSYVIWAMNHCRNSRNRQDVPYLCSSAISWSGEQASTDAHYLQICRSWCWLILYGSQHFLIYWTAGMTATISSTLLNNVTLFASKRFVESYVGRNKYEKEEVLWKSFSRV